MKVQRILAIILASVLLLSLCGCNAKNATSEPAVTNTAEIPAETENSVTEATEMSPEAESKAISPIVFSNDWQYQENDYASPNEAAAEKWSEFHAQQEENASTWDIIATLSEVVVNDPQFVPGYIAYAQSYLINYNETGDPSSPSNAMNILTQGYAETGDPLLMELKESLGWEEWNQIIEEANNALAQRDYHGAFEIINTLPEEYSGILEANRVITILNDFADTYYYLILGPALGNQYIVHFQIDGTYERVKMNEDGIYDTGTWEYSFLEDWDLRFADLPFYATGDGYKWIEYDSQANAFEYTLTPGNEEQIKEQFTNIASLEPEVSDLIAILLSESWQIDEGWYYRFNDDGTGIVSMEDNSYSYGVTYFEHPEREGAIVIASMDMPEDFTWIYDPATGKFQQESYGYDVTTDTGSVYYADVNVYKG